MKNSKKLVTVTRGFWAYAAVVDFLNYEVDINTLKIQNQGKAYEPNDKEIDGAFWILHSASVGRRSKGTKVEITEEMP